MIVTFRPIQNWPDGWQDPGRERLSAPFRSGYNETLELLDHELSELGASEAWLQLDVQPGQLRADGMLRSAAVVNHPGVILTAITADYGRLTYSCDRFEQRWGHQAPAWQANLRAIALGLEALRKVERYGIADRGQQYAGFGQIGRPMDGGDEMDEARACRTLAEAGGLDRETDPAVVRRMAKALYRDAAKEYHPDRGGDAGVFANITEAYEVLTGG